MTAQTPEPAPEAPLTFEAPAPAAPGQPNPIPRGIAWDQPITPDSTPAADEAAA